MAERFFVEFPPASTADWLDAMRHDLRGKDPATLNWTDENGFDLKPFYSAEDLEGLQTGVDGAPREWELWVEVRNAAEAQQAVALGAQGVVAVAGFEQDRAHWEAIAALVAVQQPINVDAGPAHDAGATPVQELALVMYEASLHEDIAAVSLPAGRSYFGEIAKFRAMRRLWARHSPGKELHIHARTARWDKTAYDPHVNILRATTQAMSAIIGGCDSLVVGPFDEVLGGASSLSRRLAINTQLILREEARLGDVIDPASGCWYIEALTARLADAAWEQFEKLRNGESVRLSNRRSTNFVGVNLYPNPDERPVDAQVLTRWPFRGATPFEKQRSLGAVNGD